MLVSAVIPCHNAQSTVARAVESVLEQSYPVDEIIVVNDGSTDDSLKVLQDIAEQYGHVRVIDQENKGVANARNHAIAIARGEYILTLDADDYFEPPFVEKALQVFEGDKTLGAVMCGYVRVVAEKKILPYIPGEVSLESCLLDNGALSCLLFKKKAMLDAGAYDENMVEGYEDWDLNIRLLKAGFTFGIVEEVLFNYTETKDSRTGLATINDTKLRMQLYEKYKADYEKYAQQHFKSLIIKNNKLKIEKHKVLETTSFRVGHAITATLRRLISPFK